MLPPVSTGKVRVRVFTDPAPVKSIASAGKFTFVASDDAIQRWDGSGQMVAMSADHGLPGDHVVALAADSERKRAWILTDGGLGFYDADAEVYSEVAPPPAALVDYATLARQTAALAAAADGGAWIGTQGGLLYVSERGGWLATSIKDPVRALVKDRAGWLWIATKTGLIGRKPSGEMVKLTAANGCEVEEPRIVVEAPGDRVMAIGGDGAGHERIAVGRGNTWASYRTLPELTWDAATRRSNTVVAMANGRLFRIAAASEAARPLQRDGVRFVPLARSAPRVFRSCRPPGSK